MDTAVPALRSALTLTMRAMPKIQVEAFEALLKRDADSQIAASVS
jgi:hypothetical protein